MANKFNGGAKVDGGYYWNPKNWEVEIVPDGGGTLAAPADVSYLKIPLLVAIPASVTLGASFMMALPMIGFIVFVSGLFQRLSGKSAVTTPGAGAKH
ncbi:MAG: hypothetical protein QM704_20575 [Anaeromyxobacteraceae bacterium]